ncbi:MAG TPA: Gfo/Idh/MocA family oxidoreductase [bacterium]|nr:Gfo/Idh/MocA family oxidoreductase [bacterium]HOL66331.1 Gfo/Idh/MocA family oxidoreductase [bacterium]HPP12716.1 Gfo/Idh/MocA family oxidoreductase [bacterium]
MARRLQWGVIGAGGIAYRRTIPEGILPAKNARLVAVMDIVKEVADRIGKEFQVPAYTREKDLLADKSVEAVYIATPANKHYQQAILSLQAGKHVLIEKPMALKIEECQEIVSLAERKGLKVGVDFMMRFHTLNRKIREMVAQGQLGVPVMARAQLSCWYPPIKGAWRQILRLGGGGSLMDMGCHCIDLLEYLLASRVKEVACFTGRLVHAYPVEDTAVMTVRFANGAIGIVDTCFNIPDNSSQNVLEVYGSQGSILATGTIGQTPGGQAMAYLEKAPRGYDARQQRTVSFRTEVKAKPFNTYQAQIESFSGAVINDQPVPVPGQDGLWNQKIMLAAYLAARKGKVVQVK